MLPVPSVAVPLPVPLRRVPLAILSRRFKQGEGEEGGRASGIRNVIDRLAVAAIDATGTRRTDRAHKSLRVAGDEGTRAFALTCPITGIKENVIARHEHFLRMNSIYHTPFYCRFTPDYTNFSFRCGLNRELSQPKK